MTKIFEKQKKKNKNDSLFFVCLFEQLETHDTTRIRQLAHLIEEFDVDKSSEVFISNLSRFTHTVGGEGKVLKVF